MAQHHDMLDAQPAHRELDGRRGAVMAGVGRDLRRRHHGRHVAHGEDVAGPGLRQDAGIDAGIGTGHDQDAGRLALASRASRTGRDARGNSPAGNPQSPLEAVPTPCSAEMTQELLYDKRGDIGWITFNRPARQRNALTFAMYEGLAEICGRIGPYTRGQGAGHHRRRRQGLRRRHRHRPVPGLQGRRGRHRLRAQDGPHPRRSSSAALSRPSPPSRASAPAAGPAIAAVCDFRIAAANAQFGFPIARTLGNCLSMANYARLAALVGPQRVKEMLLLARMVDGPTALQSSGW